jgi:drug/metabolite transporter (DMT)-like permease
MMLTICILANVIVGVLFKYFDRWKVDNFQAILGNYITCLTTASIVLKNVNFHSQNLSASWFPYAFVMGAVFVIAFNINAKTIQVHGIGLTTTAMKLSLILPVLTSIYFFGEAVSWQKIVGIIFTIMAIYFIAFRKNNGDSKNIGWLAILPFVTWLGSSFVDESLFLVEKTNLAQGAGLKFTSAVFMCAGFVGVLFFIALVLTKKSKFDLKSWLSGIFLLGLPNFFSIYLILFVLQEGWEASVAFPLMNISVILLSTFFGILVFNERLDQKGIIGVVLSIIAIYLLSVA